LPKQEQQRKADMARDRTAITPLHMARASQKGGCICRECGRHDQIYAYNMTGAMITTLVILAANTPQDGAGWVNIPELFLRLGLTRSSNARNHHKLAYWGLVEKRKVSSLDRSPTKAKWRVTVLGFDFLFNRAAIPSRIFVHGGVSMGPVEGDVPVRVRQIRSEAFDYDEVARQYWPNMNG